MEVQSQPGIGIKPFLSLKRHYRISVVVWLVVVVLGLPVVFLKGKSTYSAESVFQVAPRYMKNLQSDAEVELQSNSQYREYVNHLSQTVVRFDVLQSALQKLRERGIDPKPPALTERRYIERLQKTIYVRPVPDTYMVRVGTDGGERDKPYLHELVNAVMASFLETSKNEQIYGAGERLNVLQETATKLRDEVSQLQAERVTLGEKLGLTTFTDNVSNPYDTLLANVRDKHSAAVAERVRADAAYQAFQKNGEVPTDMGRSLLQMKLEDAGLQVLRTEVTRRQEALNQSIAGLGDKHPALNPALAEMKSLKERLRESEDSFDRKTRDNFSLRLLTTLNQKKQVEEESGRALQQLESQAAEYARTFQRAMQLTKNISDRETRLKQIGERLNYLETESQALGWVRLVTPALPADMPMGLGKTKLLLAVIGAAFGLALAAPVGIDLTDRRVRSVTEAEKIMGLPAAGWQILREDLPTNLYAEEQTRRFASALIRLKARHQRHVFAFASVKSEGGTTSTILDTAACLQKLGSRVLVLEANTYAPCPSFDVLRPGLTDYLAGLASSSELPQPYTHHDATMKVVGIGNERISGLQRLDLLQEAIRTWSTEYDFVLVDLPPLLLSADAELLIEAVGQVFLVVEAEAVVRGEIGRSKRLLQKIDPEAVGLFVNKVPLFRGGGYMEELIIETLSRSKASRFMSLAQWKLRWAMWLTERSVRKSGRERRARHRQSAKGAKASSQSGSASPPAPPAPDLQQELMRLSQQALLAHGAGQWAEASRLMLQVAAKAPTTDFQYKAACALLTQLEQLGWDATVAMQARDCLQRLEDLEGASARLGALRQHYQRMEHAS